MKAPEPPLRRVTPTGLLVLPATAEHDEWLTARRKLIGSSDVANILGVGYQTPSHVYYDKIGRFIDDEESEEATWGKLHEETVAREWARRNRTAIQRIGLVRHVEHPWMGCTLDRRVLECPLGRKPDAPKSAGCALEVKTRSAWVAGKWRRGCPDDVHAQGLWQMMVTGYDHIHWACLLGGNKLKQGVIRYDLDLAGKVGLAASQFWLSNVQKRIPPVVHADTMQAHPDRLTELEEKLHPNRAGTTRYNDQDALAVIEAIRDYKEAGTREAAAKRDKAVAKATLVAMLRGGDTAVIDEKRVLSYEPVNQAPRVDLEHLMEEWPDAYVACVTEKKGRQIRLYWEES